jgi:glycosyltransferase involved in cell wall biosynthesis
LCVELIIAIIFPHPLTGSLGSFRRVEEIATSLRARLEASINIYTPYERKVRTLPGMSNVVPIPSIVSALGLNDIAYRIPKYIYYNRVLSRKLLIKSLKLSRFLLSPKTRDTLSRDGVSAIQAEQDISLPLALKLGEELGIPVVADLHNISAEELVGTGVLARNDEIYVELQRHIRECLLNADRVCVVSEAMRDYVRSHYDVPASKILLVPPGGRLRHKIVSRKRQSNKVVFSGTIAYREHVDLFVESLPYIREEIPEAEFYATRKGEDLNRIMRFCRRLNVSVNWVWFSDEKDLFSFLCDCAVGVLPSFNDVARVMGTPIKLFDYMSVGLPVVANRVGGWSEIIEQENIGLLTNDDPKDFAIAILRLLEDEDLRARLYHNALDAVREKYNWERSVEPLAEFYENLS